MYCTDISRSLIQNWYFFLGLHTALHVKVCCLCCLVSVYVTEVLCMHAIDLPSSCLVCVEPNVAQSVLMNPQLYQYYSRYDQVQNSKLTAAVLSNADIVATRCACCVPLSWHDTHPTSKKITAMHTYMYV